MLAKSAVTLALVLGLCALTISHGHAKVGKTILVNCDKKETLAAAISAAVEGDAINVSGTCNERVTIDLDNLTLDGGGTAVIDGTGVGGPAPLLLILASNITVRGITVENSPGHDIAIRSSGSATIQGTIVQNNARHGIAVGRSGFAVIGGKTGNHDNPPPRPRFSRQHHFGQR